MSTLVEIAAAIEKLELLGAEREEILQARAEVWEEQLRRLAANKRINLQRLPGPKSAPEKLQLAAAMKTTTSVSNRWLAQRLQMGAASSVTSLVHRFRAQNRPEPGTDSKF